MVGMIVVSCKKPTDVPTTQDVVFKATPAASSSFKDSQPADCTNPVAHYASIDIDGTMYTVDVFYLNGIIYTNTLKLAPGAHTINSFVLQNDNGTPGDLSDDFMVQATPMVGSEYENFVEMPLPFEFAVDAFYKSEVNLQILCFVPNEYQAFGFTWFTAEEVNVREVCFYGDFCTKYFEDYGQSLYAEQMNGLQHDMPAIFKIDVYRNGEFVISYNNESFLGEGAPLCVKYPDFKNVEDSFEFKLSILVKVGESFEYVPFHTFTTVDAEPLANIGEDNVMDFVLGSCVTDADLVLAPYMNLPATADVKTAAADENGWWPGTAGTFLDISLSGIGSGYDISNGLTGGWIGGNLDDWYIYDYSYTAKVYSSLYPDNLPVEYSSTANVLDNINWLANNLYRYPGNTYYEFQFAVLGLVHPPDATGNPMVIQMMSDALAYGEGYVPPVGGNAAVLFDDPSDGLYGFLQYLIFIVVDP